MTTRPHATILTIDDERSILESITAYLEDSGYTVLQAENGRAGLEVFRRDKPDLILVDLRMPEVDGLEVLATVTEKSPDTPIIVVSGTGVIADVIEALRLGAWDYILKPIDDMGILEYAVRKALERARLLAANKKYHEHLEDLVEERTVELKKANEHLQTAFSEIQRLKDQLQAENMYLREEIKLEHNFGEIIGQSEVLKNLLFRVAQVAPTDTTVLILGETGTGKELIARAIHHASPRKDRPLVKVNCAALPAHLIESELFGHEKGAFTGARTRQIGRFELAHGATIFLDEIGELPLELQAKLLRVLQDGEFERLGSPRTMKVDVRVIAATNRDPEEEVRTGRFRQDLYYRLNVYPLSVPPLRERPDDIPLLVQTFVQTFSKKLGKQIKKIPRQTINTLRQYTWPGNVRELENVIERAMIITQDKVLRVELPENPMTTREAPKTLHELERDYIIHILESTNWRVSGSKGAAVILGMHPETLRSRMKHLDIQKPDA